MNLGKIRNGIIIFVIVVVIIGIGMIFIDTRLSNNFCESKGYDWYHFNTDEGYISCCNTIIKDHIKTDDYVCKAFEYRRLCGNMC